MSFSCSGPFSVLKRNFLAAWPRLSLPSSSGQNPLWHLQLGSLGPTSLSQRCFPCPPVVSSSSATMSLHCRLPEKLLINGRLHKTFYRGLMMFCSGWKHGFVAVKTCSFGHKSVCIVHSSLPCQYFFGLIYCRETAFMDPLPWCFNVLYKV